jgi:ABC-2 type transport system permease protein
VSAEGAAFWIIRTAPVSMRDFLWSKFWIGLVPVLALSETLTVTANELLGVDPFLKVVSGIAIVFMSVALVGLATGMGARYPRFSADNPSQVAGSFGGIAFMVMAVLFVLVTIALLGWPSSVYLFHQTQHIPLDSTRQAQLAGSFALAALLSLGTWWFGMRTGVKALEYN